MATVWNIDWPTSRTASPATQQSQIVTTLNELRKAGFNAVFVQVRSEADAMYSSALEPWSYFLTGTQGKAPNPLWDPLQYWVDQGHQRGMQVHAWVNPYRAGVRTTAYASNHVSKTKPELIRTYDGQLWFDPGMPGSTQHSQAVIEDIVRRYDVDGIVFDDYFYPYPDGNAFPDSTTFAAYQAGGGTLSLANWRRKNVDDFVASTYQRIKAINMRCQFGIAPFGIWKSGTPTGITGLSAYSSLYADSKKWLNMGWIDYFSPQLYWSIASTGQSYPVLLSWWSSQNWQGRHLWPSNAASRLASEWLPDELVSQIDVTRDTPGAGGNVFYSAKWIANDSLNRGFDEALESGPYRQQALVPSSPWLDAVPPLAPKLSYSPGSSLLFSWIPQGVEPPFVYVVARLYGNTWTHTIVPSLQSAWLEPSKKAEGPLRAFGLCAVDRLGNRSPWVTRVFDDRLNGRRH